jgi:hypothetical protein
MAILRTQTRRFAIYSTTALKARVRKSYAPTDCISTNTLAHARGQIRPAGPDVVNRKKVSEKERKRKKEREMNGKNVCNDGF